MKCIYLRTNLVNGKQYVGQTVNFKQRERDWKCLKANYANGVIDKARAKYDIDNFKTEILRECQTKEELNEWEIYYIKHLNTKRPNGYNIADGGSGNSGRIVSEETKKKISTALKGKYAGEKSPNYGTHLTEEQKKHLREIHLGQKLSDEIKRKISESNKGKKMPEEAKKKIGKANKGKSPWIKGKHLSYETKRKISDAINGLKRPTLYKKVYQYSLDYQLIAIWDRAPGIDDGFMRNKICECCNGIRKTHKGYRWSYIPL